MLNDLQRRKEWFDAKSTIRPQLIEKWNENWKEAMCFFFKWLEPLNNSLDQKIKYYSRRKQSIKRKYNNG